jgi:hypothetical protein
MPFGKAKSAQLAQSALSAWLGWWSSDLCHIRQRVDDETHTPGLRLRNGARNWHALDIAGTFIDLTNTHVAVDSFDMNLNYGPDTTAQPNMLGR